MYTVPSTLCSISLDPKLLDPFLPGGDSITVKSASPNGGTKRCDVIIDDNVAVRQSQTWWSNGESAATVASGYAQMDNGQVSDDNRYLYSGTGGVGKTKSCTSTEHPEQDLYSVIQVFAADRDNSHAMKKLITAYTEALEESSACA